MTKVGFYVIQNADAGQRLEVAARLTDKAFAQGLKVFINADSQQQARQLDELLWNFRPASFLPHGLCGQEHDDKIAIGWGQEPDNHDELLINLQLTIPPFFSRFRRVAEVVTQDEKSLAALRSSWRFYKERGYELEKHDL
ncbi:MAG: DNA polymerase III subunit chi [Halioglobus sp.]